MIHNRIIIDIIITISMHTECMNLFKNNKYFNAAKQLVFLY